ncbi:uncharacterized protein [Triticum aestivum]|nr:uncharacterized protein LOC123135032 [Triticum aestivum]
MASYMKKVVEGPLGTGKAFICLSMLMLLVLSSEKMESHGCIKRKSGKWTNDTCIIRGTCNGPCRDEGFDNGHCHNTWSCICYKNCSLSLQPPHA